MRADADVTPHACRGATFSDSATAMCSEQACYQATFSNSSTATCSEENACGQATFSGSATATCYDLYACGHATFSGSATVTCSVELACFGATFNGSATATCSAQHACYGTTSLGHACCIGIGCPSDLACPSPPPPPSPPPLLPPAAPSGANACGSGTSLNGATGQCEASLGEGTAVEGGKVVIACSGNRRLDEYEGAQGPKGAAAVDVPRNQPDALAELGQLFGIPAFAEPGDRASAPRASIRDSFRL